MFRELTIDINTININSLRFLDNKFVVDIVNVVI